MRIQENGASGEARTRAFLLDRFWILERSIDMEGADFFIQRRLTSESLLSREPPKLGAVQAKFYQDDNTTQFVHREYIVDESGEPREEFFLLCHTGSEDDGRMYLLTAADVHATFEVSNSESRRGQYCIPGREVLSDRWLVTNRSRALMRMEQSLINANFQRNRHFISWAMPNIREESAIDSDYLEEIDNWYGSIPEEFFELRKRAREAAYDLDDYMQILIEIAETKSPKVAVAAAERFDSDCLRHVGRDLFNPSFADAVLRHDRWVQLLKSAGLLDAHATLRRLLIEKITSECLNRLPFDNGVLFMVDVEYDFRSLGLRSFSASITSQAAVWPQAGDKASNKYSGVISSTPGKVTAFIDPSVYGPWLTNPKDTSDASDFPSRGVHYLVAYVMEQVLEGWYHESV